MSPTGKSKGPLKAPQKSSKKAPKKSGTGVAPAQPDYPASTNVSSPIQAASRRRIRNTPKATPELDLHTNGYARDDFVVADDDESDAFEPVREKGTSRGTTKRPLGPPITIDERIANLPEMHQRVVEGFLITAKEQSQKVGLCPSTMNATMLSSFSS
jgi:bloom syndrome protein